MIHPGDFLFFEKNRFHLIISKQYIFKFVLFEQFLFHISLLYIYIYIIAIYEFYTKIFLHGGGSMKKGHLIRNIVIAIIVIGVLGAVMGKKGTEGESSNDKSSPKTETVSNEQAVETEVPTEAQIEYTAYTTDEMIDDLEANAMNATDKYKGKYIQVTGKLSNIDAQGSYISLSKEANDFTLLSVQCFIKTDEQKEAIKTMNKGDTITLKGKCTDVGEILGYTLNIDSIG